MAVEYQVKYTPGFDPTIINVSQNDVGRQFDLKIIDETGAAQQIPSGSTVKFVGMKPSGLGFTVNCTFNGAIVHVTTTGIMTDEHGLIPAEVQITNGNTVIGTANVNLRVEKNPHPEGTIDDNIIRVIPTFNAIFQRLNTLESSMSTAQNNISNLQTRMTTAEGTLSNVAGEVEQQSGAITNIGTELGGIRTGYDGTVYLSAGDAVRAQAFRGTDTTLSVSGKAADAAETGNRISDLKTDINTYRQYGIGLINLIDSATWTYDYSINASGVISQNNGFCYSSLIPVSDNLYNIIYLSEAWIQSVNTRIHAYNSSGEWIKQLALSSNNNQSGTFTIALDCTGVSYIRISTKEPPVIKVIWIEEIKGTIEKQIDLLNSATNLIVTSTWEQGVYGAGAGNEISNLARIRTGEYLSDKFEKIFATNDNILIWVLAWDGPVYMGVWTGEVFEKSADHILKSNSFDLSSIREQYPTYKFKLCASLVADTTYIPVAYGNFVYTAGNFKQIINENSEKIDYDKIVRTVNRIADGLSTPRQSIIGYKNAYSIGFKNLLCDLRFTSDNIPVCYHDSYLNQTYTDVFDDNGDAVPTSPAVYVAESSYQDLLAYDFGYYKGVAYKGTRILTFEQMLDLCKCLGATVYIEMKVTPTVEQFDIVYQMIRRYGMEPKIIWAPQTIAQVNALIAYKPNVYIQFHTNTSGWYTEIPDSYIEAIVNATNDYNSGRNTMVLPSTVTITNTQLKTLSSNGIGICTGLAETTDYIDTYISRNGKIFVESMAQTFLVGQYLYDSVMDD